MAWAQDPRGPGSHPSKESLPPVYKAVGPLMPTSRPRSPQPPAFVKWVGGLLAFLNLFIIAGLAWMLLQNHREYQERAELQTLNLAEVLEENVVSTLERADLAILSVRDEVEHDPHDLGLGSFIRRQVERSGLLSGLCVTDAQGRILHGASQGSEQGEEAILDTLRHVKEAAKSGVTLTGPLREGPTGPWHLRVSRRWNLPDGTFAGMISGHLPLDRFNRDLAHVDLGASGTASLRATDFSLLARHPAQHDLELKIGSRDFTGPYLDAVRRNRPSVQFTTRSLLDGETRTYTLLRIEPFDLFLLVGLGQRDYLRPWRHNLSVSMVAILMMVSLTLALGWQARAAWIQHLDIQERLRTEEEKYRLLAENVISVVWTLGPEGQLTYVSPSILGQRGWAPEEFMALPMTRYAAIRDYAERIQERIARVRQLPPGSQPFEQQRLETSVACKDGREIQVEVQWRVVWGVDGQLLGFQGVTRDITERKRMEAEREVYISDLRDMKDRLEHMAQHDHLTGLPNRWLFTDRLEQALIQARRRQSRFALMFIDLDKFKSVNDIYGHEAGDALLIEAGHRLKSCIRNADTLARMGGDEYTALLLDIQDKESILRVAQSMVEVLARPFSLGEITCTIGGSIGIAIYPINGDSLKALQSAADLAMYAVKQSGRNGFHFAEAPIQSSE